MTFIFSKKKIQCPVHYDLIPLNRKIEDLTFVVFDTETTGFRVAAEDRLLEIGAVKVEGYEVKEKVTFQTFSNPHRHISQEIIHLTGITSKDVEHSPEAIEVIQQFFTFIEGNNVDSLVGHYVRFDELVLKSEMKKESVNLQIGPSIDTLNMIGYLTPSNDMRDLERYAQMFGTRIYPRHRALQDALTTAYLFVELLELLKEQNVSTWGELIRVSRGSE
ncbi:3'-5' exonuclease [Rossellomorea aquimaris]|uniref:3'-5' exonuclease n=1 Tax=Rossellomorea aquimaris TaxID=189382 RepID=UPI0007D06D51|nr:3'-5' exonuclease [Rossellomorea aquimaris]